MKRIGLLFALFLALALGSRAEAAPVPTNGTWQQFAFTGLGDVSLVTGCDALSCPPNPPNTDFAGAPPWTFTIPLGGGVFNLVGTGSGDEFSVLNFGGLLGATLTPGLPDFLSFCSDPVACLADTDNFSRLSLALGAGGYSFEIMATASAFGAGFGFFQVTAANPVPIPSTVLLVVCGLFALGAVRRQQASRPLG